LQFALKKMPRGTRQGWFQRDFPREISKQRLMSARAKGGTRNLVSRFTSAFEPKDKANELTPSTIG
jgi:hypothetical protein